LRNLIEAAFWIVLGIGFALAAIFRPNRFQNRKWLAAIVLVLFGVSDIVETHAGAWWRPWWLLGWKAVCVCALLTILLSHRRQSSEERT
jgi:peptidoglycan/LPS O-acetylase OafA/YrhL